MKTYSAIEQRDRLLNAYGDNEKVNSIVNLLFDEGFFVDEVYENEQMYLDNVCKDEKCIIRHHKIFGTFGFALFHSHNDVDNYCFYMSDNFNKVKDCPILFCVEGDMTWWIGEQDELSLNEVLEFISFLSACETFEQVE